MTMTNPQLSEIVTPEMLERKAYRRLKDYQAWKHQPREPLIPEDEGRELEFAWGDAWDLGWTAALTMSRTPQQEVERIKDRETELEAALRFYADEWHQDADAELTANGWEGTIGPIEPTEALLNDFGTKARALLNKGGRTK